ncbi:class I SAM-dependent methyltransferase [Actinomadura sp. ATCC 31491]|uniref:Class I SAM-dependent methyltransferase n=1 Tax=Actinomadura luzonensis TaxID=2805427 RepID=A0ABT0FSD3_9ACTN|nr:class I SAM-dependent methyltransferase [Actinomadura luzonensis]MCK2215254.1 class I SAM-dependent methyltransferase [Actinomadura luzonensis]
MNSTARDERHRRYWDRVAASYDRQMRFWDRRLFGDTRAWICGQAHGDTLEVAVGTGMNLPLYSGDVRLTGIEWSPAMLARARRRATELGLKADLRQGDARALDFPDATFDVVVCTFSLCSISDDRQAVAEMVRVLRPGGLLLLADHVAGANMLVRAIQRLAEVATVPLAGEHYLRRPLRHLAAHGLSVERRDRFKLGIAERLAARKPPAAPAEPRPADPATG